MKLLIPLTSVLIAACMTGCLSSTPQPVSSWLLENQVKPTKLAQPKFGVARMGVVNVRAPYDNKEIAVLRADGSMALDPFNEHAALPSRLLKNVVFDALTASGLFQHLVGASSTVSAQYVVEVDCRRLALDCTGENICAVAEIDLRLVGDRQIVAIARGEGKGEVVGGNIGAAFSSAVSSALAHAIDGMR